ncbi:MAG: 3-dehydroquinate synthase family protein, partial [Bacteroidota bacterium]|nr:3-dehydroquinate synthase family protein [Bacteroidota bacterium]
MKPFNENIKYSSDVSLDLKTFIQASGKDSFFIITDDNVLASCYEIIKDSFDGFKVHIFSFKPGEKQKSLETTEKIWHFLLKQGASRKTSMIINLGGGTVTDIGGFAASVFKRGVSFINIPTTLLAMVDAAIGGKNGINYGNAKNQLGVISQAELILISEIFLDSLNKREFMSGVAEMLKHTLLKSEIHTKELFSFLSKKEVYTGEELRRLIQTSTKIKAEFVTTDRNEMGIRQALNFGHTFGHALEGLYAQNQTTLKHGEAVAAGMIMELFLSHKKIKFNLDAMFSIISQISEHFDWIEIKPGEKEKIIEYMKFD